MTVDPCAESRRALATGSADDPECARHLAACEACRTLADQVRASDGVLHDRLRAFVDGGDFASTWAAATGPTGASTHTPAPRRSLVFPTLIALAATATLALAVPTVRHSMGPETPCGTLSALEPAALAGTLEPVQVGCLKGVVDDETTSADLRLAASRLVLTQVWVEGDKAEWRILALRHLRALGDDGELAYKLLLEGRGGVSEPAEQTWLADLALAAAPGWPDEERDQRVYNVHKLHSAAALEAWAFCESTPEPACQELRMASRAAARAWAEAARGMGRDPAEALTACAFSGPADCGDGSPEGPEAP